MIEIAAAAVVLAVSDTVIATAIGVVGTIVVTILGIIGAVVNHKLNVQHDATKDAVATAATAADAVQAVKDEVTTNHGKRLGKHIEDLVDAMARVEESQRSLGAKFELLDAKAEELMVRAVANKGRIEFLMKLWGDTSTDQGVKDQMLEDAIQEIKDIIKHELERGDKAYKYLVEEQEKLRQTLEEMRGEAALVEVRGVAADDAREVRGRTRQRLDVRIVDEHDPEKENNDEGTG